MGPINFSWWPLLVMAAIAAIVGWELLSWLFSFIDISVGLK